MVAFGGRLALAFEHLWGEEERAAVDRRLIQVLAERDDGLVHDPDSFQPGGEQGPDGPLDQAQAPQPEQRLGAPLATG